MELKVFRDVLPAAGADCTAKAELPLETELLISDYLPPVQRIVKCFAKPVVLQKQLAPGRLTLEGYLRCTVYYQGEEGAGLCQTEQKLPFTKALVGTKIGVPGAIVPLVVSAAPFIARMVETSLAEVDAGVVEAAQSMGASNLQIVWKVYLPEAVPSLILGASISIITLLGYTAIAGAVGAGGLGDLAVRYGYQRRVTSMMVVTVIFIIILVQVIQSVFSWLSTKLDKRLR